MLARTQKQHFLIFTQIGSGCTCGPIGGGIRDKSTDGRL